jgi:NTP pyrophosphatase (non-canonical NTP hydrolase)
MEDRNKEVLLITQEECAEVTQAISKVFRFGMDESYNGQTNKQRLTEELGDLQCMIELLIDFGIIDQKELLISATLKRKKLERWSGIFNAD